MSATPVSQPDTETTTASAPMVGPTGPSNCASAEATGVLLRAA